MILRLFLIWLIFAWCEPFSDACETVTESADTMDCGLLTEAMAPVAALTQAADTVAVIMNPADQAPDDIYAGEEMVVTGAEILRREYWNTNKWLAMSGYVVAAGVAYLRIHNDRHWVNDVIGGAAIGYLSTTFAYWIYPKIFRKRAAIHYNDLLIRQRDKGRPAGEMVVAAPFVTDGGGGLALSYTF